MKLSLQRKRTTKRVRQTLKQHVFAIAPVHKLIKNRRAINAVLSNIILIAAVIVVGFAVVSWSQYQSSSYQTQYTGDVNASIEQLQEKVIFEYVKVSGTQLNVYLLNCGTQNITIKEAYVNGHKNSTNIDIRLFGGTPTLNNTLHVGEEAYFSITPSGPSPYLVKIVTLGGSTFVGSS